MYETSFFVNAIYLFKKFQQRLDGRGLTEFRKVNINYGTEWGSAHVSLGETKVLAQVSCDVVQPKSTRPNEGLLHINVELGPMAALSYEAGRSSPMSVHINRILERAFKDSRAIDLESLCIVADEKVWNLRVDINVLNDEGNIIDCASMATLAALAHFKRPDVTTTGDEFIIHTHAERDPIPITIHHYPVCVSFAIFGDGLISIADPTAAEERIAEASIVFGLNSYRELCGLHLGGITLTNAELLLQCAKKGATRAQKMVDAIKESLLIDEQERSEGVLVGFNECIRRDKISSHLGNRLKIKLRRFEFSTCTNAVAPTRMIINNDEEEVSVEQLDDNSAVLISAPTDSKLNDIEAVRKWVPENQSSSDEDSESDDEEDEDSSDDDGENEEHEETIPKKKPKTDQQSIEIVSDGESEEEETTLLN